MRLSRNPELTMVAEGRDGRSARARMATMAAASENGREHRVTADRPAATTTTH